MDSTEFDLKNQDIQVPENNEVDKYPKINKFRESNMFPIESISRNIFGFPHTVWKFQKFSPTAKIFRQIDLQYNSLVKYSI